MLSTPTRRIYNQIHEWRSMIMCGFTCKQYCKEFEPLSHSKHMYALGYVYCKVCQKRQRKNELSNLCPCCGAKVRYTPVRQPPHLKPEYKRY